MIFSERIFKIAYWAAAIAFTLIIGRLFMLQVIRGERYLERSESNFIQERPIAHSRGIIFDQSGIPLVDNRSSHDVYVTLALLPDSWKTLKILNAELEYSFSQLKKLDKLIREKAEAKSKERLVIEDTWTGEDCRKIQDKLDHNQIAGFYAVPTGDSCELQIDPQLFPSQALGFSHLQAVLQLGDEEMLALVQATVKKAEGLGRFKPILFLPDVDFDTYARISSAVSIGELPGVAVYDSKKRRYIYGGFAAHTLGYLNEISPTELSKKGDAYRSGDRIGRRGLEAVYENVLRGDDGIERFVVDAKGRRYPREWEKTFISEEERITPPVPGNSLVLALDKHMQEAAEKGFRGKSGSVVAIDVNTGFVLALANFPSYDPNQMMARNNAAVIKALTLDPLKPWVNKATQGYYAPGSTFKAVTGIAGLEHDLITTKTQLNCTGVFRLGKMSWRCFKREGHGIIDLSNALKVSCDAFFYQLGYLLGPDRLAETSRILGFGRKTGIDLDVEGSGTIPDKAYYIKRRGYYSPGLVVNTAIGQGDVAVTPLQLALAYAAIVNGGIIYRPQLVRQELAPDGSVLVEHEPIEVDRLKDKAENLAIIKDSLSYVMTPGGTAYSLLYRGDYPELSQWLRTSKIGIGGKTGTAQVVKLSKAVKHVNAEDVTYLQRDHAWFVGFTPLEKPEIVVVAMTEHGGMGGTASAPVVAEVIRAWYEYARGVGRYHNLGAQNAAQQ